MDFSKHIQKAEEAERRRNYDFAVELYSQLLEIDPDQGEARGNLRRVLKKRFGTKKGGRFLRAIGGAAPLMAAKALRKAGRHDACSKSLEKYLSGNPLDEEANLMLGMSLEDAGHFHSACAVYEYLAEIAPKNPEGLKRAGSMMARTGDPVQALEYYERALKADPRDQDAMKARKNLAAEAALSESSYDKVQHSREQIKDKDAARSIERGQRLHLSKEELEEEYERLQARIADDSGNADLMVELARILERLGEPDAAIDMIERALTIRSDSTELQAKLGELKVKALKRRIAKAGRDGDEAAAEALERELWGFEIDEIRRRLVLHPGDAVLRIRLARLLIRTGAVDDAIGELQKSVSDARQQSEAWFLLGRCFQEKRIFELARKEYSKALDVRPSVDDRAKEILYNLGAIAEAENDPAEARSNYLRIYEVDIGYRDVAQRMETLK